MLLWMIAAATGAWRKAASCFMLSTCAVLLWDADACASVAETSLVRDPRLQGHLEAVVKGRPLGLFLERLSQSTGVELQSDTAVGDQKIILIVKRARVGGILELLAEHFHYAWTSKVAAAPGKGAAEAGYRLWDNRARQGGSAEELRRQAASQQEQQIRSRLERHLQALRASPAELEALARQDSSVRDVGRYPFLRARLGLAALLSEEQRALLASGQPFVSDPIRGLPPAVRALVESAAKVRLHDAADQKDLRYTLRPEFEDGSCQLWFRLLDAKGQQVGDAGTLIPYDPSRRASGLPVPRKILDAALQPQDPALQKRVLLQDSAGRLLPVTAGLPALLEAVASATGFEVLSDHYSRPGTRFDPEPLGERPLRQLLNIIAAQFHGRWEQREGFLLFRHQDWFEEELAEIPERLLEPWHTTEERPGPVSAEEFLRVVGSLTPPQIEALHWQFPGIHLLSPPAWPRLLGSLDQEQRERLLAGKELHFRSFSRPQRELAALLMRGLPPRPGEGSVELTLRLLPPADGTLETVLQRGSEARRYRTRLPTKQSALKPPVVEVRP
jgi:hypothetical protein